MRLHKDKERGEFFFFFAPNLPLPCLLPFFTKKYAKERERESYYLFFFLFRSQKAALRNVIIAVFLFFLPRFGARAECEKQQTKGVFAFLAERHSFLLRVHRRVLVRRFVLLVFFCSFASKTPGSEIYK
jgi:hypothetical protein